MEHGIKIYHDATWNNKTIALVQIDGTIMPSNVAYYDENTKRGVRIEAKPQRWYKFQPIEQRAV